MMKLYLLLVNAALLFSTAFAQKQNVYFLKNNGKLVNSKDSADFIRIISEPDSGSTLFNISEYYPNGKIKLGGKTSRSDEVVFEGQCISFYPTGKRQQIVTYKKGDVLGDCYAYYPNGKLYTVIFYEHKVGTIKSCYDSTGKALMTGGEGRYISFDKNFKTVLDEGNVSKGEKVGEWKGYDAEYGISYTEIYTNGKLMSGQGTDAGGIKHQYSQQSIIAYFIGGDEALNKFVLHNINYPELAKRYNIQGKVFVQFYVNKDGTLSNFKVFRDPGSGLGDEALRVIKLSPKWVPGLKYGCPVATQFTIPVNFSLTKQ